MSVYYSNSGAPLAGAKLSGGEIASERRFGEAVPLSEGLNLIADYLDGLSTALTRHTVLPAWSAFLRGQHERFCQLLEEISMSDSVVTRADLAQELWRRDVGTQTRCKDITDGLITAIAECLRLGKTVHLQGLGRFYWIDTPERPGRNPRTGEPTTIPAGRRLRFKPSKKLNAEGAP